jgi:hypothetical protein
MDHGAVPEPSRPPWYARLWGRRSRFALRVAAVMWFFVAAALIGLYLVDGPATLGPLTPLLLVWALFAGITLLAAERYRSSHPEPGRDPS